MRAVEVETHHRLDQIVGAVDVLEARAQHPDLLLVRHRGHRVELLLDRLEPGDFDAARLGLGRDLHVEHELAVLDLAPLAIRGGDQHGDDPRPVDARRLGGHAGAVAALRATFSYSSAVSMFSRLRPSV